MQNIDGRLILTAEVAKNIMAKKTRIYFNWASLLKYILVVLVILFFATSAVRISLPSIFCITPLPQLVKEKK